MKNIPLAKIGQHAGAILLFFLVTVFYFRPIFFDHKVLNQHDITEYLGTSKELRDYRAETGEEALWASRVFSGMPAYLISVDWSDGAISWFKRAGGLFLPHPVSNIFWSLVSFYLLLIVFGVRPWLAITGAIAFGFSSFMIIGLGAGHNGRIGAIAFMPAVLAGIHLLFERKTLLGFSFTSMALALHLRENHLQMTYYLLLMVLAYGIVRLVESVKTKTVSDFVRSAGLGLVAAVFAAASFFGQFWSVTEYGKYSIRGKSELNVQQAGNGSGGLNREYAFEYSNGIIEPLTLLIPNILGGSTMESLISNESGKTYQALATSTDPQLANQLAPYTIAYWGSQSNTAPYYAGAVMVFLFVVGLFYIDRRWVWWLLPVSVLSIVLSWGSNFAAFNNFVFDYLPGYNKFRSVTFTLVMILMAMPLIGMMGLESILKSGINKQNRKGLFTAFGVTGGLCLLLILIGGFGNFSRPEEAQLPVWLLNAMKEDRQGLLRSDAVRSLIFISIIFISLWSELFRRLSVLSFCGLIMVVVMVDIFSFNTRYFGEDKYRRKAEDAVQMTEADKLILQDTSYYRVYNLVGPMNEARTSYFHHSIGGYHGAKIRRYQDLYDSLIAPQTQQFIEGARTGNLDFDRMTATNMLNVKYIVYGPEPENVIPNPRAFGPAWFVNKILAVENPTEELKMTSENDLSSTAVVDRNKFEAASKAIVGRDSLSRITLESRSPRKMLYRSINAKDGMAVFSEVYYPEGWEVTIDGKQASMVRVNYILRGLLIPAGEHQIEFKFEPSPFVVGDKITASANWLILLFFFGSIFMKVRMKFV
ncbi:MAG: YfhO family protein [Bacteroidetes bacterium]|nr:YfhO family protein [Bacteroidota bacterium]